MSGRWCWDTWHLGVSRLMERCSFRSSRFFQGWKEARGTGEGVFQSGAWVLYRLHGNSPNVLSNYHLVFPHAPPSPPPCRSNCRSPPSHSPSFGETTEEGLVERGYKAMVTSCWFLTTYGTVVYALVTFTHYILEGRHGTFNSLFKGMKNSREVERAAGRRNFLCRLRFPLFPTFVSSSYLSREICQYTIILKLFQNYNISPFASNIKLFYSRQLIFSF